MYIAIKNAQNEGTGYLSKILNIKEVSVNKMNNIDLENYEGLIILGGPIGAYQIAEYPFLEKEINMIKETADTGKRVLGVCLGAQLISKAFGGTVKEGAFGPEIGIEDVSFTGRLKELGKIKVFQLHRDTFTLPDGSELLAYSNKYFQAFRIGRSLGLQFHVEFTEDIIREIVKAYNLDGSFLEEYRMISSSIYDVARRLVTFWLGL